uniref:AraC family transcriptional regulator n=1 Tax=Halomonas sp. TaxID=1486246 RepID=UPI00262BD700|nr:helix-turn-helix domain-containing protein [Halomonas sp.]
MGVFNNSPLVGLSDIRSLASVLTQDHRCSTTMQPLGQAPLLGHMYQHEVQPGLFLRINRIRDRVGLHSEALLSPGLKVAMVWKGEARISLAGQSLMLGQNSRFKAMVAALDHPAIFQRQGIKGGIEYSVVLTATPAWLLRRLGHSSALGLFGAPLGQQFPELPIRIEYWQPSQSLVHKLESLDISSTATSLRLLDLEAVALNLISESLAAIDSPVTHTSFPSQDWTQRLEYLINSGEAGQLSQSQLAQRLGMSLRQLQRRYHRKCGAPLGEHLRQRRLRRAHDALTHESISIESAAAIAGYNSAANFATAFRKAYGMTPSACRKQGKK